MRDNGKYIDAMLPVYASASFRAQKPDKWDEMTKEDKIEYF